MNGRNSDADFGKALRHGRTLGALAAALVLATAGLISVAYGMAQSTATSTAERVFASEDHRVRLQSVADTAVEKRVAAPLARLEVEVRQMREIVERIDAQVRLMPRPQPPERR